MLEYGVVFGPEISEWQMACVRALEASGAARLRCAVTGTRDATASVSATAFRRFCTRTNAASQRAASEEPLDEFGDEVVRLNPYGPGVEWQYHLSDLGLDFVLLFAQTAVGELLERSSRYGLWRFSYGDPAQFSSAVPGFWEVLYHHDMTAAALVRSWGGQREGAVLKSAYLPTVHASFKKNVDILCAGMAQWPAAVCRNIVDGVAEYLERPPAPMPAQRFGHPTPLHVVALRAAELLRTRYDYIEGRTFSIDWNVGITTELPHEFIGRDASPTVKFVFPANQYSYVADPCVVRRGSRTYLFCEEYDQRNAHGYLVRSELNGETASSPVTVIDEPHHLSYPHVFEHEGSLYCIPEAGFAGRIGLYRYYDETDSWEYAHTLIEGFAGVDSTVVRFGDKWWLFTTSSVAVERGYNSHLYIWYADDLLGPWTPHVRNPVKMDVRSARCAGPFFTHEGQLYRPVQDCGAAYGRMIHIARIDTLTERDFEETLVGTIRPPAGAYREGIHTISAVGDVCVVDARRNAFSPWRVAAALKALLRRISRVVSLSSRRNAEDAAPPVPMAPDSAKVTSSVTPAAVSHERALF